MQAVWIKGSDRLIKGSDCLNPKRDNNNNNIYIL